MFSSPHCSSQTALISVILAFAGTLGNGYGCRSDENRPDEQPELATTADQPTTLSTTQPELDQETTTSVSDVDEIELGTVVFNSQPAHALVELEGFPRFFRHPADADAVREIRTPITLNGFPVDQPLTTSISLPGYLTVQLTLPPIGEPGTQWVESDDGAYQLELNTPLQAIDPEAIQRRADSEEAPQVFAEITIQTNPAGARISYQGLYLVDSDGHSMQTPASFSEVGRYTEHTADSDGSVNPDLVDWAPVALSRQGVPIRVELEGYAPVIIGLYHLMFRCDPIPTASDDAPYWERCQYRYDTGLLDLLPVEEVANLPAAHR